MGSFCRRLSGGMLLGLLTALAAAGIAAAPPTADKPTPQMTAFFETSIRPLLLTQCTGCHGSQQQMGGLRLDSSAALWHGGSDGPVVIPGNPDKSLLIQVVRYNDKVKMPPAGKLKPAEIAALEAWVKMGAPWPDTPVSPSAKAAANGDYVITPEQREFWSFRPIQKVTPPRVKDPLWNRSAIDRFVLAKLQSAGLTPAPQADRRTLLRRVTYDITGLPPAPEEIDAFLADKSPNAYAKVVDRLLASPRYGERWGRHWLDIARYSDTKGYVFVEDSVYHNAYTYRDYVIRAFNEDLPYDQFVQQQLAADLLPLGDDKRPLAALGFLTLGRRFLNDGVLIADDRIDTTCRGLMGLTVACARCHDHKFDPIPTKDYYSLYGVFASAVEANPPPAISPKAVVAAYDERHAQVEQARKEINALVQAQCARLRRPGDQTGATLPADLKAGLQKLKPEQPTPDDLAAKLERYFEGAALDTLKTKRADLAQQQQNLPPQPEYAMALQDAPQPVQPHVFRRGNPNNQGDAVPRRFLAILSGDDRKPFTRGSGRLEMAQDIASPQNPLTARVLVNRVWLYHFGEGLVRTPSDFGTRGERPTHPELLDWLASTFIEQGWSIKKLHRLILLSQTYQQSSEGSSLGEKKDPENRLLWRQNRQRLDLEAVRDSLLAVSGHLDEKRGGPSVDILSQPFTGRRTVYGYIERQNLPGFFRTFDFASPDTTSARRYLTTVPQQALYWMNSPFVMEQAQATAERPELAAHKDEIGRIRALYRLLFGRAPDPDELALGIAYLHRSQATMTPPVWQYGYGAYEETSQRVHTFTPFAYFSGHAWQGSAHFPDPQLQYLTLNAIGGHPGGDAQHAVIRRWVAPCNGAIAIRGLLKHPSDQGDGVQGRIVSSREGLLGHWTVFHTQAETVVPRALVHKGDTIDFVVDCRSNPGYDSFSWAPTLQLLAPDGPRTVSDHAFTSWSASADFGGAPVRPAATVSWERYVQALLMTNEFSFVD